MSIVLAAVISIHLFNVSSASPAVIARAQRDFADIFSNIDVQIAWTDDPSALPLIVRDDEPGEFKRSAKTVMGAAVRTANGNVVAYVFYRRASAVLASAMAHEVGHLLLPSREHGRDGLMRACWDAQDLAEASTGQLRFSPTDAATIRALLTR